MKDNLPVILTREDLVRHIAVFGKSGTGKSTLLRSLFIDAVDAGMGATVIDPHSGDLVNRLLHDIPDDRLDDVVYLDLSDPEWTFGINLFAAKGRLSPDEKTQKVNQIKSLFGKVGDAAMGPLLNTWLPVFSHTFLDAGEGTFADIPRVLMDTPYRNRLLSRLTNNFSRVYWQRYTDKNGDISNEQVGSTLRAFGKFLTNELLEQVVGQEKTTVPFQEILDNDLILLVSLPQDDEDTTALIGTLIFQELFNATVKRRSNTPHLIIADEAQLVTTPDLARFIDEARKRNVGICLATQRLSKIDDAVVTDAMLNVGTLVTLTVDYDDAAKLGRRFPRMAEPSQTYLDMSAYPSVSIWRHGHPNPRAVQIVEQITDRVSEEPTLNGCDSVVRKHGNYSQAARNSILFLTEDRFGIKEKLPDLFFELHAIVAQQPQLEPYKMSKPEPADKQLQLLGARHGFGAAMVNIRGNEERITIASYDPSPDQGYATSIREQSRRRYYWRRSDVTEEIRKRNRGEDSGAAYGGAPVAPGPSPPNRPPIRSWPD